MLFLSLIIIIRSSVMHFSQIWLPSPNLEAIFGFGYVLGHFGGQICHFWFRLNFSNFSFFQLFCNEIVKLGTFFHNLAKKAKTGPKWPNKGQDKSSFFAQHILRFGSSSRKFCTLGESKWWNMICGVITWKNFTVPKLRFLTSPASLLDEVSTGTQN